MSRTDKDVHSERALYFEAIRTGKIYHNHSALGRERTYMVGRFDLSKIFYKRDSEAIQTWMNTLDEIIANGVDLIYTVEDKYEDPIIYDRYTGTPFEYSYNVKPLKKIIISVKERKTIKNSAYCFDPKFYNIETKTDSRDGGYVSCEPTLKEKDEHLQKWFTRDKYYEVPPRSRVRTPLNNIRDYYNFKNKSDLLNDDLL